MTCTSRIVIASLSACVAFVVGAICGVIVGVVALDQARRNGR